MELTNAQVANKLREVAAAYTIKGATIFQIRAYETAANIIEQSTEEIYDLWSEGRLDLVPGLGGSLQQHFTELFQTGKVKHWEEAKKGIPGVVFELLNISGIGPKTAQKLAGLGIKNVDDLEEKIKSGSLVKKGFSAKIAEKIKAGIKESTMVKSGRMLLPYAFTQAQRVLEYLKSGPEVKQADALGSLRRMVPTIGDLDFAVGSDHPQEVIDYISKMPGVLLVVDRGERDIAVALTSGLRLDFIVTVPISYGALLQHFTGSKKHNIHLRTLAEGKGFSLSEYGVKRIKNQRIISCQTEDELYKLLGMQTPPPEIREDTGEIEAALTHKLPKLIELKDIKGDLHVHCNFPIEPSHDSGTNSIEEIVEEARRLGYQYIGIADHSPGTTNHDQKQIIELIKKRSKAVEQINYSENKVRVLKLLEVDIQPDGNLAVPDEGLRLLDFALAGVHSVHKQPKEHMTKRILKALENPYVKALTHPTGRLLNERSSYEADWETIFKFAAKNNKAMEINAFYNRLDLPDTLVRMAKALGVKFIIDTDSHSIDNLDKMIFGVSVARRGWLAKDDVINSWDFTRLKRWFNI